MPKNKKIILSITSLVVIIFITYATIGISDYLQWTKTKQAVATGGYPWQCGVTKVISVIPGCTRSAAGKCTCAFCDMACEGTTEIQFIGQPICGVNFACVFPGVPVRGGGTTLMNGVGKQAILASTAGNIITTNGVVAMPSGIALKVNKVVGLIDYVVAKFKK